MKRSAAIPAQSPTLSPTLSAITAGFLGSSSGIPASTFPTKSAPTSAPFVKMPPPSLANIEINEAPNPKETKGATINLPSKFPELSRSPGFSGFFSWLDQYI